MVLQHKQNGKYSFAIPDFPVMEDSFIHEQEEKWEMIHVYERDSYFNDLESVVEMEASNIQNFIHDFFPFWNKQ